MIGLKQIRADAWAYLQEGFLKPWFAVYAGIIGAYDLASGPLGWPGLELNHYKYVGLVAFIVGPFVAFRALKLRTEIFANAIDGEKPVVGDGLEFVRQSSRYTAKGTYHKYMEELGVETKTPPPHMAELIIRTTGTTPPRIRTACSEPVYSGIADYPMPNEKSRMGGRPVHETQSVVVYRFGSEDIPAGTEIRFCAGSPNPIKFLKVEVA